MPLTFCSSASLGLTALSAALVLELLLLLAERLRLGVGGIVGGIASPPG